MDKAWRILETRTVLDRRPWYVVDEHRIELPDGRIIDGYPHMRLRDYAIVVAITDAGDVLLQRLYKHGVGHVTWDLVAGLIDDGEQPLAAARRELLEEAGCASDDWTALGSFVVNSNYGCGRMHAFLARGIRRVQEPASDDLEESELVERPFVEALDDLRSGRIELLSAAAALALASAHGVT